MGGSMGCVRPSREDGSRPPKKRPRFRFKHKGFKSRRAAAEDPEGRRRQDPEDGGPNESSGPSAPLPEPTRLHGNALSPGSASAAVGGRLSSGTLDRTPKPSPAWRGVFCLPGEEETVSAIVDVSSIPSQTTPLVNATPEGGRVCRVREKAQGVVEKPWILQQRRGEDEGGAGEGGTTQEADQPSNGERRGVVHIREVDGKLCVVRTMYPSDYSSPVWRGAGHKDLPAPPPIMERVLDVQLLEDRSRTSSKQLQLQGSSGKPSLLESGYSSDLPLTSPGTAGTTPSQTDWGGLTSSSSEKLDSTAESPLLPQRQTAVKHLPQVCVRLQGSPGQCLSGLVGLSVSVESPSCGKDRLAGVVLRHKPSEVNVHVQKPHVLFSKKLLILFLNVGAAAEAGGRRNNVQDQQCRFATSRAHEQGSKHGSAA